MATLFESYTETTTHSITAYGTRWCAQTFTPTASHTITSAQIYCERSGSPGTVIVSIKATDANGAPTGDDLTSGTFDGDAISTSTAWVSCDLGGYNLVASTKYALVWKATSGDGSNYISHDLVRNTNGDTMYTNGARCRSSNSGVNWIVYDGTGGYADEDALFKEYGAYSSGELAGLIAIVEERFHYVDAYGAERYIEGTVVG